MPVYGARYHAYPPLSTNIPRNVQKRRGISASNHRNIYKRQPTLPGIILPWECTKKLKKKLNIEIAKPTRK